MIVKEKRKFNYIVLGLLMLTILSGVLIFAGLV